MQIYNCIFYSGKSSRFLWSVTISPLRFKNPTTALLLTISILPCLLWYWYIIRTNDYGQKYQFITTLTVHSVLLKFNVYISYFLSLSIQVFTILGKNDEGHTQYVSLYWGSPLVFLRDLSGLVTRPDVFVEIHFMNLIVR